MFLDFVIDKKPPEFIHQFLQMKFKKHEIWKHPKT